MIQSPLSTHTLVKTNSISIPFPSIQEKLLLKVPTIVLDQTLGQIP